MSLTAAIARQDGAWSGALHGIRSSVALKDLQNGRVLAGKPETVRGATVLLATREQLPTALALLELDGVAKRIVLATPDLTASQLQGVAASAEASVLVTDEPNDARLSGVAHLLHLVPNPRPVGARPADTVPVATQWVLLTSGTTGAPKLVLHDFATLAGALPRHPADSQGAVWSTFYDIRRYGGLQIFLRALLSAAPLVLSHHGESTRDFLARAALHRVTHISGTPSHWRRALMSGEARLINPRYVRLSGEIADQALLDQLRVTYPEARIAHAFASTEAGVAFDINDERAGFPAALLDAPPPGVELKVAEGTLWIRSARRAAGYLGNDALVQADGFVDTGDLVELIDGRYHFRGRRGGIINVGGLKVYPEEVESVLNAHPQVRMSRVKSRRNPITGAIIVAEIVRSDTAGEDAQSLKEELLDACRRSLPAYKVPALISVVPAIELNAAGKVVRPDA